MAVRGLLERALASSWPNRTATGASDKTPTSSPLASADHQDGGRRGAGAATTKPFDSYSDQTKFVHQIHELTRRDIDSQTDQIHELTRRDIDSQTDQDTSSNQCREQNVLVRLVNDTLVSLDASGCLENGPQKLSGATLAVDAEENQFKLCLISNWSSARLVQANGSVLWPPTADDRFELDTNDEHPNQYSQASAWSSWRQLETQLDTASFVFASATFVISLLGIIANLLILLIILINTKQKLPNFLNRTSQTSHTNYHSVLLFQLTLTGLLLGSSVLFQSTCSNRDTSQQAADLPKAWPVYISPLSVYLDGRGDFWRETKQIDKNNSNQQQISLLLSLSSSSSGSELDNLLASSETDEDEVVTDTTFEPLEAVVLFNGSNYEQPETGPKVAATSRLVLDLIAAVHIWTVAGLAFDRYRAIAYPLEYLRAVSSARAKTFLVVLWLVALLVVVLLPGLIDSLDGTANEVALGSELISDRWLGQIWTEGPLEELIERLSMNCTNGGDRLRFKAQDQDASKWKLNDKNVRLVRTLLNLWNLSSQDSGELWRQSVSLANIRLVLWLVNFVLIVVVPLVIVTICNMSIYGIVKGHERRMSASSGSQQTWSAAAATATMATSHAAGNTTGSGSFASSLRHNFALFRRNNSSCSSMLPATAFNTATDQHHHQRCDTCSSASSILNKLVRASHQVGVSMACQAGHASASSWSSSSSDSGSSNEFERETFQRVPATSRLRAGVRRMGFSAPSSNKSSFQSTDGASGPLNGQSTITNRAARRHRGRLVPSQQPAETTNNNCEIWSALAARRKLKRKLSDKNEEQSSQQHQQQQHQQQSSSGATWQSQNQKPMAMIDQRQDSCDLCSPPPAPCRAGCCSSARSNSSHQQQTCDWSPSHSSARQTANHLDSDGIMRQLKFAGLSFAGVAINELMQSDGRRALDRSSSCSLGNLTTSQTSTGNTFAGLSSFCSVQSPALVSGNNNNKDQRNQKRSSYVTMAEAASRRNLYAATTRLLAGTSLNSNDQLDPLDSLAHSVEPTKQRALFGYANFCSHSSAANQTRIQFNVVFNVVVWLILALLICSIPQHCLLLLLQFGSGQQAAQRSPQEMLTEFLKANDHKRPLLDFANKWPQMSFLALNCLCRSLFLLTLPLNAWLYGIRSRSLKITLRMMLRKYISKKQASIEIDQRRKSVQRSRESSIAGFGPQPNQNCPTGWQSCCQFQNAPHHNNFRPNQHQQQVAEHRLVRRCASFNLPSSCSQRHHLQLDERTIHERNCVVKTDSNSTTATSSTLVNVVKPHANSIRFVLGDEREPPSPSSRQAANLTPSNCHHHQQELSDEANLRIGLLDCFSSSLTGQPNARLPNGSVPSSLNSSLASSNRSLLSASIQSSHSAAFLLLNGSLLGPDKDPNKPLEPPPLSAQPLASVLKNSPRRAWRQRRESCDSAAPTRRSHSILVRVQSSPGTLIAPGSARFKLQQQLSCDDRSRQQVDEVTDIKFLLTKADDNNNNDEELGQHEPLVGYETKCETEMANEEEDEEEEDEEEAEKELKEFVEQRQHDKVDGDCKQQHQVDYYKRIKGAVASYFAARRRHGHEHHQRKRRRRQTERQFRCSCGDKVNANNNKTPRGQSNESQPGLMLHSDNKTSDSEEQMQRVSSSLVRPHRRATVKRRSPTAVNGQQAAKSHMKSSLSIDSILSQSIASKLSSSNNSNQDESSKRLVHLQPPNSLKLLNFDQNGANTSQLTAIYSSLLALSPIKECSSTHSCASSLSSLNNLAGGPQAQMGELAPKAELAAAFESREQRKS